MLALEIPGNPDDHVGVKPGCMDEQLTKMHMVGIFQLALDYYLAAVSQVIRSDAQRIATDRSLLGVHFKFHAQSFTEYRHVLRQPGCEFSRLIGPNVTEIHALDGSQLRSSAVLSLGVTHHALLCPAGIDQWLVARD